MSVAGTLALLISTPLLILGFLSSSFPLAPGVLIGVAALVLLTVGIVSWVANGKRINQIDVRLKQLQQQLGAPEGTSAAPALPRTLELARF